LPEQMSERFWTLPNRLVHRKIALCQLRSLVRDALMGHHCLGSKILTADRFNLRAPSVAVRDCGVDGPTRLLALLPNEHTAPEH
jgi:hypothetical protein